MNEINETDTKNSKIEIETKIKRKKNNTQMANISAKLSRDIREVEKMIKLKKKQLLQKDIPEQPQIILKEEFKNSPPKNNEIEREKEKEKKLKLLQLLHSDEVEEEEKILVNTTIDENIKKLKLLKLLQAELPENNITEENNTLIIILNNEENIVLIEPDHYTLSELIECINLSLEDIQCSIQNEKICFSGNKNFILKKCSLIKMLGFMKNEYSNSNIYVGELDADF